MASGKKRKRHSSRDRINTVLTIAFFVILLSLIIAYAAGIYLMRGRFLQNTYINGIDYSHMSAEEAESFFRTTYEGKTLTLLERGGNKEKVSYDEIGYRRKTAETFQSMIDNQNYLAWPLTYLEDTKIRIAESFEYSEEKLDKVLKKLRAVADKEKIVLPVNAQILKGEKGFYLEPEVMGNRIVYADLLPAVEEAINNAESELDLEAADVYMKPKIYQDDKKLTRDIASLETLQNTVLTIAMEGGIYEELNKTTFLDWVTYKKGKIKIDEDEIVKYTGALADKYDTYLHERQFKTHEGDTVTVGGGNYDNYGYLMNREKSAVIIGDALKSGISQTIALDWDKYALTRSKDGSDFGDTYIEISIDQQRMWYYKDGVEQLSTSVVTGTAIPSRATPTGCFHVLQMLKDHTMKGSYGQSFANFVIAIMTNGICIHDASWREDYGGEIFLYDGSHGCINTPFEKVSELYEMVEGGTPVIIYDRWNTVPDVQNETYTG